MKTVLSVFWAMLFFCAVSAEMPAANVIISPVITPREIQNGETINFHVLVETDVVVTGINVLFNDQPLLNLEQTEFDEESLVSFWTGTWTTEGLVSQKNEVVFQASSANGEITETGPYTLFNTISGTNRTDNSSGMLTMGKHTLLSESILLSCAIDSERGYIYFGTGTFPGQVIKFSVGNDGQPPRHEGTLVLEAGEDWLSSVIFDREANELYFGTGTDPAKIVRVSAGEGGRSPERLDALTLEPGEAHLETGVIDKNDRYAYWGTNTSPGQIIKTRLADGEQSMEIVGRFSLEPGENSITHSIYDPQTGFAYYSLRTRPGRVVQVSTADNDFGRTATLVFEKGEDHPETAVFDKRSGTAFFGTATDPGQIVEVTLQRQDQPFQRKQSFIADEDFASISSSVYDQERKIGYFGNRRSPGQLLPFELTEGGGMKTATTRPLPRGTNRLISGEIDNKSGRAYFGTETSPGRIVYSDVKEKDTFQVLQLAVGEDNLSVILLDEKTGYAYIGTGTWPGKIIQVNTRGRLELPRRKAAVTLEEGKNVVISGTLDRENGMAYFGTWDGSVHQFSLERNGQDFQKLHTLSLESGLEKPAAALFNDQTGTLYFATDTIPGRIIQIKPGNTSEPPEVLSVLELPSGRNNLVSAVINPAEGYALFGTACSPARLIKIELSDTGEPPLYAGSIELEEGENNLATAFADNEKRQAFFGTVGRPGRLVQIDPSEPGQPPVRLGALELEPREYHIGCSAFDMENRTAYVGTETLPARLVKVRLDDTSGLPQRKSAIQALRLRSAAFLADQDALLTGMYTSPGRIVKTLTSFHDLMHFSPVELDIPVDVVSFNLYALSGKGTFRLGIYGGKDLTRLVWESGDISPPDDGGWIEAPVIKGSPQYVTLEPGSYFLAWKTSSRSQGAAYLENSDAISYAQEIYGDFPQQFEYTIGRRLPVHWSVYLELLPEEQTGR